MNQRIKCLFGFHNFGWNVQGDIIKCKRLGCNGEQCPYGYEYRYKLKKSGCFGN